MTTPNPSPAVALEKWMKTTLDLLAVSANECNVLKESAEPVKALQALARSFDKLSLRCNREAVTMAEAAGPCPINPLFTITAQNVCAEVRSAARDLEHNEGMPRFWEDFSKTIKETVKTCESMQRIISQSGVQATVMLPGEPLMDADGNPLV